jgi:hypothetical protein
MRRILILGALILSATLYESIRAKAVWSPNCLYVVRSSISYTGEYSGLQGDANKYDLGHFRTDDDWQEFVRSLVKKYYPMVLKDLSIPDGYTIGFVLRSRTEVIEHKAVVLNEPGITRLIDSLHTIFPDRNITPDLDQGLMYFPGVRGIHKPFRVEYVTIQ